MVFAMLTIAFHMLMFFWHQPKGTMGKLFGLLPAVLVCALLVLKPVTCESQGGGELGRGRLRCAVLLA
jgi:hypothetical protein